jgi:hypothetical protein
MDNETINNRKIIYNKLSKEDLINNLIECEDLFIEYVESLYLRMHWKNNP